MKKTKALFKTFTVFSLYHMLVLSDSSLSNIESIHQTDKFLQHRSITWPAWLNGCVFVYKLSGCGFETCCSH